jgi:Helix-turn-helix domain
MSIAVMNWVWANSPIFGSERLVLLALADASSRDDGTGCWPSAATIARKANISDRTVRRVIAWLEAEGHVVVHRGGGRARSTNSYAGDRPPRTRLCQGTLDTALSPDPPRNHPGNRRHARARGRGRRATSRAGAARSRGVLQSVGRPELAPFRLLAATGDLAGQGRQPDAGNGAAGPGHAGPLGVVVLRVSFPARCWSPRPRRGR